MNYRNLLRHLLLSTGLILCIGLHSKAAQAQVELLDSWLNESAKALVTKAQPACTSKIPKLSKVGGGVAWRTRSDVCGGKAAIITTGKFSRFFSWVARDGKGRDRIPDQSCEVNSCSVAKVQEKVSKQRTGKPDLLYWCLGTAGDSDLGVTFRRITGKRPAKTKDPLKDIVRYCIKPTQDTN